MNKKHVFSQALFYTLAIICVISFISLGFALKDEVGNPTNLLLASVSSMALIVALFASISDTYILRHYWDVEKPYTIMDYICIPFVVALNLLGLLVSWALIVLFIVGITLMTPIVSMFYFIQEGCSIELTIAGGALVLLLQTALRYARMCLDASVAKKVSV